MVDLVNELDVVVGRLVHEAYGVEGAKDYPSVEAAQENMATTLATAGHGWVAEISVNGERQWSKTSSSTWEPVEEIPTADEFEAICEYFDDAILEKVLAIRPSYRRIQVIEACLQYNSFAVGEEAHMLSAEELLEGYPKVLAFLQERAQTLGLDEALRTQERKRFEVEVDALLERTQLLRQHTKFEYLAQKVGDLIGERATEAGGDQESDEQEEADELVCTLMHAVSDHYPKETKSFGLRLLLEYLLTYLGEKGPGFVSAYLLERGIQSALRERDKNLAKENASGEPDQQGIASMVLEGYEQSRPLVPNPLASIHDVQPELVGGPITSVLRLRLAGDDEVFELPVATQFIEKLCGKLKVQHQRESEAVEAPSAHLP